jgi:hypothetical protein
MSDAMLRRLVMEKVIRLGTAWLQSVLDAAGTTRISDLSHEQLTAIVEERDVT